MTHVGSSKIIMHSLYFHFLYKNDLTLSNLCDVKMPHLFSKALDMQSQQLLIVLANSISIMTALHI